MYATRNRLTGLVAACTLAILQLASAPAHTQNYEDGENRFYVGLGLAGGVLELANISSLATEMHFLTQSSFTGLHGRLGYQSHPNMAFEWRVAYGFGGAGKFATAVSFVDAGQTLAINVEATLDRLSGFYGLFGGQIGPIYLYGIMGLAETRVTVGSGLVINAGFGVTRNTFSQLDVSWGVGIDIPLSNSFTGTFERLFYSDSRDNVDDLNFTVTWSF